ncbi:EamA family transporter [Actinosynnema sp. ALI-1.44]|uniref:EamA family transporter n=1 Tax=Actinosynnema sp. ALI-1.44 TaxID=1933779 RepID=UPI00097CB368|nr:EamA family transporter [Actinosynnema sp. ALI-1.44]ONI70506.1 EamA family transporter [Actinosynnema sp. ALI-1.44]
MTTKTKTLVTTRARGTALVLAASAFFATSGPLAKPAMAAGLTPQQVVSVRIGLAAVLLGVGVAVFSPRFLRVGRRDWRVILGFGLFGVAGAQTMYFAGVSRLPVGIAMLLEFTSPLLVALWIRFVRKTVLPAKAWAGTAVAVFGLAMVAQVWDGLRLDTIGVLAGVASAICAACYFLVGEHGLTTMHPLTMATYGLFVGAVILFVIAPPWTLPRDILVKPTPLGPVWTLLVAVAVLSTAIAYSVGMSALRHLPSTVVSVLSLAEPVIATAVAWAVLDEELTVIQIMGGITLLAGAFVVQRASQPSAGQELHPRPDDGTAIVAGSLSTPTKT